MNLERVDSAKGQLFTYELSEAFDEDGGAYVLTVTDNATGAQQMHIDESLSYLQATFVEDGAALQDLRPAAFAAPPPPTDLRNPTFTTESTSQRLAFLAQYYVGHLRSDSNPNTKNGHLGCAWAVNFIVQRAGIAPPLGSDPLRTASMYEALTKQNRGRRIDPMSPGCLIISPTPDPAPNDRIHGHVGIVATNGMIYANDSNTAVWSQYGDLTKWENRYSKTLHLPVEFYAL